MTGTSTQEIRRPHETGESEDKHTRSVDEIVAPYKLNPLRGQPMEAQRSKGLRNRRHRWNENVQAFTMVLAFRLSSKQKLKIELSRLTTPGFLAGDRYPKCGLIL